MSGFKLPGVVWSALLVALPLLSVWLQDSFPNMIWAAPVAGLLLIVAKTISAVQTPQVPNVPEMGAMSAPVVESESRAQSWLWG